MIFLIIKPHLLPLNICVPKNPANKSKTIEPLGGMSAINEKIIPPSMAINELAEEIIIVCLNDFDRLRAINVGITRRAETNKIPTALMLITTTIATRMVKTALAKFTFFRES